jgi:hypothetical protein
VIRGLIIVVQQWWWQAVLLSSNTLALLTIKENTGEGLDKMAVTLTQRMFHDPLYCAHVMGDGSSLAWVVTGAVIATSPVPVSFGHCPGFAGGMFIAQNATSIISSVVTSSQHFQCLLMLVSFG